MIPLSKPQLGEAEIKAVTRVFESGQLVQGPEVEGFEEQFRAYTQTPHAVAIANGTLALNLGLMALGVGPGDEVIVPSFTFIATANAVRLAGATPVFADIDLDTFCISVHDIEPRITHRTVAVIAVHLFGHPAQLEELGSLCRARGLALIEDAAQALGTEWQCRHVGTQGALGAFSFYPTKTMTTGEGGMVTTSDPDIARKVRLLRNHGTEKRYVHEVVGTNARMTEIAAAIGSVQLERVPEWHKQRSLNAAFYDGQLPDGVVSPTVAGGATHSYHQYTVRTEDRENLLARLDVAKVGYGLYYATPCHRQKAYEGWGSELPNTDRAAKEVVSLPVRPDLTPAELEAVANAVIEGSR